MDMRVFQLTVNHTLALENTLLNTLTCMADLTYLTLDPTILYFAWADQRDKVCFIFHKVQGCCMENKAQL